MDEDEPEREWFRCRLCHGEDLAPGERHECLYASHAAMSEEDECSLLELLNAAPISTWSAGVSGWDVVPFSVGGWTVAVFFDGPDCHSWDYVEHVISPTGARYDAWPAAGEVALPMSIANWTPPKMGPVEEAVSKMKRIAQGFRDLVARL